MVWFIGATIAILLYNLFASATKFTAAESRLRSRKS